MFLQTFCVFVAKVDVKCLGVTVKCLGVAVKCLGVAVMVFGATFAEKTKNANQMKNTQK